MALNPKLFESSGYNDRFNGTGLSFSEYIRKTQTMLKSARIDLTREHANTILSANSPYEWLPENSVKGKKIKRGVLLIHGLYDSPFVLMDVGRFLVAQGYLVRAILLPGHGTVPGDLLNVQYTEWVRAVDYAVESMQAAVEEIFLVGFSLGGALAVNKAARSSKLAGLILLAPALAIQNEWVLPFLLPHTLLDWATPAVNWLHTRPQHDYAKYESLTVNSACQIYKLVTENEKLLKTKPSLSLPIFAAVSAEDETIQPDAVIDFFKQTYNPRNQLWIYGAEPVTDSNPQIHYRNSYFPEQKICDFSHLSLPIAPDNPHYGAHGDYKDFLHYPNSTPPPGEVFLGSRLGKNLKQHVMQRLSYNPDFSALMLGIKAFLG